MTRRTFLKTATGAIVAAAVIDRAGEVASFFDEEKHVYTAQVLVSSMSSNMIVMLHSVEHLSVGDPVVSNGDGLIRKLHSEADKIIGYAVAMTEVG